MKIVIFGASGGMGLKIVEQALAPGQVVTAFVRSPPKMGLQDANLTLIQNDIMDATARSFRAPTPQILC